MKNINPKMLSIAICLIALSVMAAAQKPSPSPTPTPERSRQIVALLNDARLAAPELGVDTFLKVVESKKVTDPVWRKEIIDEALRMIDDVQYPMPMRPAYGGRVERNNELLDTEDFVLVVAYGAKLDRLSFRGRVITLLLETDRERAKQMIFQMGGQFGLKPRSCEDALTYSPDGIYTVVGKVAKAVFTEQQIAEGQRALFVAPWIENIESPRQIYPALDLLQQMQGSAAERQILFNAASRAINRDFKDDRSFTYGWEAITARTGKLIDGESDPLKSELKSAFRGMLLKNLRGTRCNDNEIKKDDPLPDYIEAANKLFPEKPLTFEDVSTSEFSGTVKVTNIVKKSSAARKFGDELKVVRDIQIVDNKIVKHDVTDVAWVSRVNEFIDGALSFEGTDNETDAEMLFLKGALVGAIIDSISPGELRKSVVRKYLRLIAGSRLQKTNFIEWRFWITDAERMAPESFWDIASEFPNPNLKVMAAASKLLEEPKKESPKPTPTPTPTPEPERPREVVALLNDARLAAPELAVDTFLKVVKSKQVTEPAWRREILEEALRMADDVKNPVRRKGVTFRGVSVDTHAGYLSYAYDLKLDGLSLKARIIKQLLSGNGARAKQIVFEIGGRMGLKALKCEDTLIYDVSDIYGAAGEVAKAVFTQKDIAEGIRALYVAPWFENIESPAQIGPALDLLAEMQGSPIERQILSGALSKAINRNFDDDRTFGFVVERDRLTYKVGRLVSGPDDPLKTDLQSAFRDFLVKNFRGSRCTDNEIKKDEQLPPFVREANLLFAEKSFTFEDIVHSDLKGRPKIINYWQSNNARRMGREFREVRDAQPADAKTTDEPSDVEWGIKVSAFVESLESWKPSENETESEVFNQKCVLFHVLIELIPDGKLKKSVIRSYMRFLGNSSIQKENFIEWLDHVRWLSSGNPEMFNELASESPNPQFRLIVESTKLGF